MTELTPLALKLRTTYRNSPATGDAFWNEMAGVVEAELAAPRPVRLPTVEEVADVINRSGYSDMAREVLDLVASLNPAWVPVPADATIPAGTLVRVEEPGTVRATEFEWRPKDQVFAEDRATENFAYFVPSGTVLTWGRYRKKPVVIEAMQLVGTNAEFHSVYQWIEANTLGSFEPMAVISTLEGLHWADPGDWIIRGVQGEFYPCKPDIFAATYEPAGGVTL